MPSRSDTPTVLVVDDEEEVADVYSLRLRDTYKTCVAYSGADALDSLDETVDIVLLDRRMPDISGDEVLARIRENGYDCRVIMLTAVNPGLDIIEMSFDDYLCKPVEKETLVRAIEQQLRIQRHDDPLSEYFEIISKHAFLEAELSSQELTESDKFRQLQTRAEELETNVDTSPPEFGEIESAFRNVERYPR